MHLDLNPMLYVLLLPFLGSVVQALIGGAVVKSLGPKMGKKVMGFLAVAVIAAAFGIALNVTQQMAALPNGQRAGMLQIADWITLGSLNIPFELGIDPLAITMTLIITGIGSLIHLYATGYMAEEKEYTRFFTYLNLFVGFMLCLVLGGNMLLTFVGWEGVGVCSYLLIGFWYKELNNARAANKAFIVNRIGDWGMSLGMFMLAVIAACYMRNPDGAARFLSYDVLSHTISTATALKGHPEIITAICLLLFVGAMGKSAQFPLYLWLPDAMAGPTPVSALIHAATMVTAGVFLLNRMAFLFVLSPMACGIIALIGAFTALFAALIAFGQTDIKKVLAYSTVSQLGYMFIGCGAGAFWTGMFHVTTHAFFKALLFLGSGAVIHAMAHEQDMRNYGSLWKYTKLTCIFMFCGWAAICGIPYLSGAASKDAILESAFYSGFAAPIGNLNPGVIAGWMGIITAFLTPFYMTRMMLLTFFSGKERWKEHVGAEHSHHHAHDHHHHGHAHAHGEDVHGFFFTEAEMEEKHAHADHDDHHHGLESDHQPREVPVSMWFPLLVLAIPSLAAGYYLKGNNFFKTWLENGPVGEIEEKVTPIIGQFNVEQVATAMAFAGIICGVIIYAPKLPRKEGWDMSKWSPFRIAARNQFYYDKTMVDAGVEGGGLLGRFAWKQMDAGFIDLIVNDFARGVAILGAVFRKLQAGLVRGYALVMLLGLVGVLAFVFAKIGGGN